MNKKTSTIIRTFADDIYIIQGKTPEEVEELTKDVDSIRMPNGSYIHPKTIASKQSYEDYTFQVDQKNRHKKGQYLKNGEWNDNQGPLGITAHLEHITGELALPAPKKKIK